MNRVKIKESYGIKKFAWLSETEKVVEEVIDKMCDMFEARKCGNCKHHSNKICKNRESIAYGSQEAVYENDGCNKFEKQD